jgi:uncharacterized repeat protein (TIGR01451 family)
MTILKNKYHALIKRWGKVPVALALTLVLLISVVAVVLAAEYIINDVNTEEEINGAVFQFFTPADATGTGAFDPFLRISANKEIVQGYNTDLNNMQYDEDFNWTDAILLSQIPYTIYNDVLYREFQLDINQVNNDPNWFISLDEVQIWLGGLDAKDITGFVPETIDTDFGAFPGFTLQEVYNLDADEDNWLKLNYTYGAGSGKRDLKMLVPDAYFGAYGEACEFMGTSCEQYVVFYSKFGIEYPNNDGFEEWGLQVYNLVKGFKWHDMNADGVWDTGEPPLEGWRICALEEGYDPICTYTREDGSYILPLPNGTYTIQEECETDWQQSFPAPTGGVCGSGTHEVTVKTTGPSDKASPQVVGGRNFGNYLWTPDIEIDKTGDLLSKVGDTVNYTIVVTNTSGPGTPDLSCRITDPLLSLDSTVTIATGGTHTLYPTYVVQGGDPDPLLNTASVSCTYVGDTTVQATDSDDHSVNLFQPSITLVKTGDELSKIGDLVDYTITLTNTSSADTPTLECTVTDAIVNVNESFTIASGDPPKVISVTDFEIPADAEDPFVNTATALCSPVGFPNTYDASDTHSINLFQPSIAFSKTGDTLSKIGDPVDYTLTLTNTSSADTPTLECTVTDTMVNVNESFSIASGDPPKVISVTNFVIPADADDPFVNTAEASCSPVGFPNVLDKDDTHSINLFQPSITLVKTGDTLSKIGDMVDYTITLTNTSSADTPDLECTIVDGMLGVNKNVTLASGANDVTNVNDFVIPPDALDPFDNTATALCSPIGFPNILNASDTHSINLFQPSITFSKTGDELSKIGDLVDYTLTLTNTSSADTPTLECTVTDTDVNVNESFSIASGDPPKVISVTDFEIPADAEDPYVNTAYASCSPVGFPNVLDEDDTHSINLFQPSITFSKTGDELSKIGDLVDYTITLTNTSSMDTPNLECTVTDAMVNVNESITIASGDPPKVISVTDFEIPEGAADPYVNTAYASCSPVGFPNVLDEDDTHSINLFQPSITLVKTGPPLSKIGDLVDYTITLTNTSSADTPNLECTVTDALVGVNRNVTLASGASDVINVIGFVIPPGAADPFVNTATAVCSPVGFPNTYNASDTHSVNLFQPSITFTKIAAEEYSKAGDTVHYTITLTNTSSMDAPDLVCTITDTLLGINQPVTLASGAAPNVLTPSYVVQPGDPDPLVNTASVSCSPVGFPNILTASAQASVDLVHPAFTLTKECTTEPVIPGNDATFQVVFSNTGDVPLVVTFDEDLVGTGCPLTGVPVTVNDGTSLTCTIAVPSDTGLTPSVVSNTINAHVTLPAMYALSNQWFPYASDTCDIYAVKSGYKWEDMNADGVQDMMEPVLPGWKIHFYAWDTGTSAWSATYDEVLTNAMGKYEFNMVLPGVKYAVCEVLEAGYVQTFPNPILPALGYVDCTQFGPGYGAVGYEITLQSGEYEEDNNFGNFRPTGCTYTQGYWKTHSAYGPAGPPDPTWLILLPNGPDTLFFNSGYSWHDLFWTAPAGGNAYIILAHQYMAAWLNINNVDPLLAANPTVLGTAMSDAEWLFNNYNIDYDFKGDPAVRNQFIMLAGTLNDFNEGYLGPPHCE